MSDKWEVERRRLIQAILPHVVFDGWTHRALRAGAADLGLESWQAHRYFPGGPADAAACFSAEADRAMLEALENIDLSALRVRDRVATAVRLRLEYLGPHKEAVRRGLALFALPAHAGLGLTCLYRGVDAIWHGIGDRSTDYNFYSKRLLLAGVLSSTLVFWLDDQSEGHEATWAFLERRIDEVMKIGGRVGKVVGHVLGFPDRLFARRAHSPMKPSSRRV